MEKGVNIKPEEGSTNQDFIHSLPFKLLVIFTVVLIILVFSLIVVNLSGVGQMKRPALKIFSNEMSLGSIGIFGNDPITNIYSADDCSETSLKSVWDSIFKESSNGAIIIKDNSYTGTGCPAFYMYKVNNINPTNSEVWILEDIQVQIMFNMRTVVAMYVNGSPELGTYFSCSDLATCNSKTSSYTNSEVYNMISDRTITDISSAQIEYNSKFKVPGNNWVYNSSAKIYIYNESIIGNNLSRIKAGLIPENKTIDYFYYLTIPAINQIISIPNFTSYKNSDWKNGVDLDNHFTTNPAPSYRVVNLGQNKINTSISNDNNISFKPEVNFTGTENFKIIANNDNNFAESNVFRIDILDNVCNDSDFGQNYSFKGNTRNATESYNDSCYDNNFLREYYCVNTTAIDGYLYACNSTSPYNICSDGACVLNTTQNRTPVFTYANCDESKFTWYNNASFSINLNTCFSDPDNDPITYRYSNSNSNLNISLSGSNLTLKSIANWSGTGSFYVYANDSLNHETTGSISYRIYQVPRTNSTIPPVVNSSIKVINPIPNETFINESLGMNLTFSIGNNATFLESIKWYLDDNLVANNSLSVTLSGLSSGTHTLDVIIKKGSITDRRSWRINIYEEKPKPNFIFSSGKVLLYLTFVVVIMIIILVVWLFVQENQKKNKKMGIDLSGLNKKGPFVSSNQSPNSDLDIPR